MDSAESKQSFAWKDFALEKNSQQHMLQHILEFHMFNYVTFRRTDSGVVHRLPTMCAPLNGSFNRYVLLRREVGVVILPVSHSHT